MKAGKTINELAISVAELRNQARDYRVTQSALTMAPDLNLSALDGNIRIKPSELMHSQIADKLGVPTRYYNRMMTEAPELLRANVNEWLGRGNDKRFLRTLAPKVETDTLLTGRAFLGNGYKPLDNYDMMEALLPPLSGSGLRLASSEITEKRLYMQLVTDKITASVRGIRGDIEDKIQLGLVVSNSEVGWGALSVQVLVYRLVCTNGMIVGEDMPGFRKVHVGANLSRGDDASVFTDETKRLTDAAVWAQASDAIKAAVSQSNLDRITERLNGIATVKLANPETAVELVAKKFDLVEDERKGVMRNLIEGGDVTQWGLLNAVTALANNAASYDRAIELETIGGKVAGLSPNQFGNN